ncbi:2-polyprenyl-6-methoxyphenol hydroxylase [Echinicola jeungdonensis]|uniref:2-polyprenyl-6-methoxyphenol hydroxylase n=1 Tax=Echinicola jeungdonensis TaxID=709343 RepID=A0ABV5J0J5_9BACT|nr:2-polyprenyl-6-methoxyphenol hydroxylase [Echinicola jeungdonensis]MDN3667780.1 2-polyprenyl-6-methoxyphenol hydroxylase [Echinicola jeungdonensis]
MKLMKYLMVFMLLVFAGACSSENEEDINPGNGNGDPCENNNATLSGDVLAIINANCAVSGCHVPGGTGTVDFTVKENIIQNATTIRTYTQSGFMPPPEANNTLSEQEKDDIYCWVANGAQDN